ncbi:MAG: sulfatase-like hydrolase/transferase [Chitinophagaceae bacterium]|nr:sulfatase-like hydrolase/transferase [Chitinophagaceae bacterium]
MVIGRFKPFQKIYHSRFSMLFAVLSLYIALAFLVRVILFTWAVKDIDFKLLDILGAFLIGFLYDLTTGCCFLFLYTIYLLLFPKKWIGSALDKALTYIQLILICLIFYFSFLAEIPFWDEFGSRFNFIAVDYLIYTFEVVQNINQSYPLPLIIAVLIGLVIITFVLLKRTKVLKHTFSSATPITIRAVYALPFLLATGLLLLLLKNKDAELSNNRTTNEIGKNGVFSFFAAFRSNELDYASFYLTLPDSEAYALLKKNILQENQAYTKNEFDEIARLTKSDKELHPNIILIAIESFSADFLRSFGNNNNITPYYDSLAGKSLFFTNLYATGTRTVRGMEALTLCVPPTPGNSIVRRPDNENIFSIATILRQKNYHPYFIYGGDGYFDNMNNFFGGQGFDIVDRNRGNPLSDNIASHRYNIPSGEVSFENAWGICDEDLYKQAIKYADKENAANSRFFQFIMTTSNHKPYTYPDGKIDLKQGTRDGAVKYTDYALNNFINAAQKKPWFNNTVFVIVADHCASSAGKWEITIDKHHIPAIIYNLNIAPQKIERLTSQIDLMPTLFGYLGWSYSTELYGRDINKIKPGNERAFIGNYRTLGLLKGNLFTQIDDRKRAKQFTVAPANKSLSEITHPDTTLVSETISFYQTASERFKNGKMKENR